MRASRVSRRWIRAVGASGRIAESYDEQSPQNRSSDSAERALCRRPRAAPREHARTDIRTASGRMANDDELAVRASRSIDGPNGVCYGNKLGRDVTKSAT